MEQSKFYQIKNVTECEYTLVGCDGSVITRPIQEVDKSASAFTIQDAKAGDVLAWDESKCIVLFKNIYDKESFNSYGFIGHCTGIFESRTSYHDIEGVHPATKEQRDTLLKAMADAGYTFDFGKKELRKIEQKQDTIIRINPSEYINDMGGNGCYLKNTVQVSTCSEEDENQRINTIELVKNANDCTGILDKETALNWLKSLKDRYTWKPSEEQMGALHDINLTGNISYAGQGQELINLYNDLKKLRE